MNRCVICGGDVHRVFAGANEVLRHVVPPRNRQDAHYPRVEAPKAGADRRSFPGDRLQPPPFQPQAGRAAD